MILTCDYCSNKATKVDASNTVIRYFCDYHWNSLWLKFKVSENNEIEIPAERLEILYPETNIDLYNSIIRDYYWYDKSMEISG